MKMGLYRMAALPILTLLLAATAACHRGEAKGAGAARRVQLQSANDTIPPQQEYSAHAVEGRTHAGGNPPSLQPMENPFEGNAVAAEEGGKLFRVFNCDGCHGPGAVGAGAPSLADGRWRYGGSASLIFETIYEGRPNGMPAFGAVLPREAIWKVVAYLESLQPGEDQPTVSF